MMEHEEKNTPVLPEVAVETDSIINDSVAEDEQLHKTSNDLFGLPAGVMRRG